jgi:hypothetical protein
MATSFDPDQLQRVMYFMLRLAVGIEKGKIRGGAESADVYQAMTRTYVLLPASWGHLSGDTWHVCVPILPYRPHHYLHAPPPPAGSLNQADAGFLMAATLELLLGEVQWLLSLLRVTQGPASPHLRALHAALKAYETQVRGLRQQVKAVAEHKDHVPRGCLLLRISW